MGRVNVIEILERGPRGAPGDMDPAEWDALQDEIDAKLDKADVLNEPDMATGATDKPPSQASVVAFVEALLEAFQSGALRLEEIPEPGLRFVDQNNRESFFGLAGDGGPTDWAIQLLARDFAHIEAINSDVTGYLVAIVDEDNRILFGVTTTGTIVSWSGEASGGGGGGTTDETVYPSDDWAHWGDSMTAGVHLDPWPKQLAAMTGRSHYNGGWGGQTSSQVAARQGGVPARVTLEGHAIPASGAVEVTAITRSPLSNGGSRSGSIAGVAGTLAQDGSGVVTFTRAEDGDAVPVTPGTYFLPDHGLLYRGRIVTIWVGRNDVLSVDPGLIAANIQQMVDFLTPTVRRVLVMEVPPRTSDTIGTGSRNTLDTLNNLLAATFAPYWVPIATWLRTDEAEAAAGVTFTTDDDTDIANGITPRSLRASGGADTVHLNEAGDLAVATKIYQEAQARGWL